MIYISQRRHPNNHIQTEYLQHEYITHITHPFSPRHIIDESYNTVHISNDINTFTFILKQNKEPTMGLYHPLRYQQGIWYIQWLQNYCLLYYEYVSNNTPVDNASTYSIHRNAPSKYPNNMGEINTVKLYTMSGIGTDQ